MIITGGTEVAWEEFAKQTEEAFAKAHIDAITIHLPIRDMDKEFELEQMADKDGKILVVECEPIVGKEK